MLSAKKIAPLLVVPVLIVIPPCPELLIVKSSALECPASVVPINTRPSESMRTFSALAAVPSTLVK